jgi:hypothetical protein
MTLAGMGVGAAHGVGRDIGATRGMGWGAGAAHGMATVSEIPATEEG